MFCITATPSKYLLSHTQSLRLLEQINSVVHSYGCHLNFILYRATLH